MELEKLSLDQLFPPIPFCEDTLEDLHIRTQRFPVYIRKKICEVLGWNTPKFHRAIRMAQKTGYKGLQSVSPYQRHIVIDETLKALEAFTAYIKKNYTLGNSM